MSVTQLPQDGRDEVELRALCKSFKGVVANSCVDLKVRHGTIYALIGENGAGKSTAMKMLYGMLRPDSGSIAIRGKVVEFKSPSDAVSAGIGMVHQHFMLAGPYSAVENVLLGAETSTSKWKWLPRFIRPVDVQSARVKLQDLSLRYGFDVDWDATIDTLPVGVQQRIEILKLLYQDASVLILDEPTAVLTPQETAELFTNLKKLCAEGKTILIITHKLKEVMNFADEATVLRAGRTVGRVSIKDSNVDELANLMVGRKVNLKADAGAPPKPGKMVLEIKDLSLENPDAETGLKKRLLSNIQIQVRSGEIVGIAGVEGNGQSELLQILLRARDLASNLQGELKILGSDARTLSTSQIKNLGVGFIPEDRHKEALLLERSVSENFILGLQRSGPFNRWGMLNARAVSDRVGRALKEYDVRPRSPELQVDRLSGGNQQKLIIARRI